MTEQRGRTRLTTKHGPNYFLLETPEQAARVVEAALDNRDEFVVFTTVTGQDLFPPESLYVRTEEVMTLQAVSDEGWAWLSRLNQLHYARQLHDLESSPAERYAAAAERMADVIAGDDE